VSGYLAHYRRLGYRHGIESANLAETDHECESCGGSFAFSDLPEEDCECGCRLEYKSARRYAMGYGRPVKVSAVDVGGWTVGGEFNSSRVLEQRDAFSMRDAKRAARYLKDQHGDRRHCTVVICFSYQSRKDHEAKP
jgi:hypothetical protein